MKRKNQPRVFRAFDVETTTINKGDPYHPENKLVQVGFYEGKEYLTFYKEEIDVKRISELLNQSYLITFNGKFDLAWMENLGIETKHLIVFDAQLAEFILSNQTIALPSLNYIAGKHLNEQKIDVIKEEYWDKGVDTWFIDEFVLTDYLKQDLKLTYNAFLFHQAPLLKKNNKWNLFKLQCLDLNVLNNMELNGIPFNKEESIMKGDALNEQLDDIQKRITRYTVCPHFNCSSGDHLSNLLYGGVLRSKYSIPNGVFKSGDRMGQPKNKWIKEEYPQERLVEPLKGSELKKEGYWSTDEYTLSNLKPKTKAVKDLISDIKEYSKIEKLQSTYFYGIPKLMKEKSWQNNLIHGRFNQCIARTGRLSASEPNQQNFDPELRELCRSEYK